ncbi:hypothetical protein BHE74_00000431 [Ensete ventricosum]|nr:hypothetical protein GW17_00004983 [Ensete ventricosum]RWW90504.1 hypothetical protein BHE74_00000431 [Ensete ventricosum]RZR76475.1 hypothetical protein BHM03_00001273 [Ensete ventricosum]
MWSSVSLKPELFEGLRFDFTKGLNQTFALSHSNFLFFCQLTNEPHFSQGMFNFDYKGQDFRSQIQIGNNAFYGANYIQVTTGQIASTGIVALSYVQKVSEKIDHSKKDYKFGFGMTVGE